MENKLKEDKYDKDGVQHVKENENTFQILNDASCSLVLYVTRLDIPKLEDYCTDGEHCHDEQKSGTSLNAVGIVKMFSLVVIL